jgi:hypothetical protein
MGGWNYLDRDTASHEAHHAALGAIVGLPVESVTIAGPVVHQGWDADGIAHVGTVATRRGLKRKLAVALAPSIAEGNPIPYPGRRNQPGDELACAIIVDVLDLTRGEWDLIVAAVEELLELPSVRDAVLTLSMELLEHGTVPGERVREIVHQHAGLPSAPTGGHGGGSAQRAAAGAAD